MVEGGAGDVHPAAPTLSHPRTTCSAALTPLPLTLEVEQVQPRRHQPAPALELVSRHHPRLVAVRVLPEALWEGGSR